MLRDVAVAGLLAFFMIILQACGRKLTPQPSCHFVENQADQRVSWKTHLPVQLYLHQSVPLEDIKPIEAAAEVWNKALHVKAFDIVATNIGGPDEPQRDGYSVVYWMHDWDPNRPTEQARTTIRWTGDQIYEADIRINAKDFQYFTSDVPDNSEVHLESLLVHELGHVLGLAHTTDPTSVMEPTLLDGQIRDKISAFDENSLKCEYPVQTSKG